MATTYHVTTVGSASNDGLTKATAWNLTRAFWASSSTGPSPGDTVWIHGRPYGEVGTHGTYYGKWNLNASGVTYMSYPGTGDTVWENGSWATIDAFLCVSLGAAITTTGTCSVANPIVLSAVPDGLFDHEANNPILIGDRNIGPYEHVQVLARSGVNITSCVRGVAGTTIRTHGAGTDVFPFSQCISVVGDNNTIRDFQIQDSWPCRNFFSGATQGSTISGKERATGLRIENSASNNTVINIVINDTQDCIFSADGATYNNIYGCLLFNQGNVDPTRGHGQSYYVHGSSSDQRTISDIMCWNGFGGAKMYGVLGGANNFTFERNILYNSGVSSTMPGNGGSLSTTWRITGLQLSTDVVPPENNIIRNNYCWQPSTGVVVGGVLNLGHTSTGDILTVEDNYIAGGSPVVQFTNFNNASVQNNTFIMAGNSGTMLAWSMNDAATPADVNTVTWDNNTYYDATTTSSSTHIGGVNYNMTAAALNNLATGIENCQSCKNHNGGGIITWYNTNPGISGNINIRGGTGSGWVQWTGYDLNSTYTNSTPGVIGTPGANVVAVLANPYETGRGHIAIYNWEGSTSVSVDLTDLGMSTGDSYAIWSAQAMSTMCLWNIDTAYIVGSYNASAPTVSIDMTAASLSEVTSPIGIYPWAPPTTAPAFGGFVVRRTALNSIPAAGTVRISGATQIPEFRLVRT